MSNNGIHIRIADILYGIIKHRILITVLTGAGLMIGIVLSGISYLRGEMSKEYIVTSSFSVNTQTNSGLFTSGYDFPNYNDINMAKNLVGAVGYVLKSDKMLKEIIDSLGLLGVTTKDIEDNLSLTQYDETQIIEISLYWRNANEGIAILSEINRKAPELLMDTLRIGSVAVINEPSSKYLIGGNVNIVLWGYMALLGFGLGIGITLLELLMHPTLLNVQDMETVFGLEVLCEIGDDKAYFNKKESLLVGDDSQSEIGESFASAAHIIQNRLRKKDGPHMIYITSALRNEGKTNVLANLAIQLSDLEKHVLLIDLDLKNPNLGSLFLNNVDYEHSLNGLYAGDITEKEAVTTLTGYMDILPAILERSAIPLDSNLFSVVRKLAAGYDYVLMDTAPVGITADPMSLNQIASQALFVVRYDTASLQEIKDALERIVKSGIGILGCIANGVQVSERGIKNPVRDKEAIQKAERRGENREEPLTTLDFGLAEIQMAVDEDSRQPLVAGFAGERGAEGQEGREHTEITTGSSFVDLLFQAESNHDGGEEGQEEPQGSMQEETERNPGVYEGSYREGAADTENGLSGEEEMADREEKSRVDDGEEKFADAVERGEKSVDVEEKEGESADVEGRGEESADVVEKEEESADMGERGEKSVDVVERGEESTDVVEKEEESADEGKKEEKSTDIKERKARKRGREKHADALEDIRRNQEGAPDTGKAGRKEQEEKDTAPVERRENQKQRETASISGPGSIVIEEEMSDGTMRVIVMEEKLAARKTAKKTEEQSVVEEEILDSNMETVVIEEELIM